MQEVLRWVMTRAQTHTSTAGRLGTRSQEEKAHRLEVIFGLHAKQAESVDERHPSVLHLHSFVLTRLLCLAGQACIS